MRRVERALGVTTQGARNLLVRAEGYGWLQPLGTVGRGGAAVWVAHDVLSVIEGPAAYD